MLVDYLEEASADLRELDSKLVKLSHQYKQFYYAELREEMNGIKKKIHKKKQEIIDNIYKNSQEFFLIKKHFPQFFQLLKEDEQLAKIFEQVSWLSDFKILDSKQASSIITEIKKQRAIIREIKDFLKKWTGKIDSRSLIATWDILKGELTGELEKDEVLQVLNRKNKELRRKGWLVMLNEPFIFKQLAKIFEKLKKLRNEVIEKKTEVEKSKGKGTLAESAKLKELKKTESKKRKLERMCEHMLLVNHAFLIKIKSQKPSFRTNYKTENINNVVLSIINNLNVKTIDEKKWLAEMKNKLSV